MQSAHVIEGNQYDDRMASNPKPTKPSLAALRPKGKGEEGREEDLFGGNPVSRWKDEKRRAQSRAAA